MRHQNSRNQIYKPPSLLITDTQKDIIFIHMCIILNGYHHCPLSTTQYLEQAFHNLILAIHRLQCANITDNDSLRTWISNNLNHLKSTNTPDSLMSESQRQGEQACLAKVDEEAEWSSEYQYGECRGECTTGGGYRRYGGRAGGRCGSGVWGARWGDFHDQVAPQLAHLSQVWHTLILELNWHLTLTSTRKWWWWDKAKGWDETKFEIELMGSESESVWVTHVLPHHIRICIWSWIWNLNWFGLEPCMRCTNCG